MPAPTVPPEPGPEDADNVDPTHPDPVDEKPEGAEGLPDDVKDGDTFAGDDEPDDPAEPGTVREDGKVRIEGADGAKEG